MATKNDSRGRKIDLNCYTIVVSSSFEKSLRKIDKSLAQRISNWICLDLMPNTDEPKIVYVKPLKGKYKDSGRIRYGKYRITVKVDDNQLIFTFVEMGHRKEIYK